MSIVEKQCGPVCYLANSSKEFVRPLLISITLVLLGFNLQASTEELGVCVPKPEKKILETKLASAGSWTNLRNNPGSLSFESARMLGEVEKVLPEGETIYFSSVPNAFLKSYQEREKCEKLTKQTSEKPFVFLGQEFKTLSDFDSWFGDFSRGKGQEGTKLYEMCPGMCSPQYFSYIRPNRQGGYSVKTEVICGPARDKSDNMYELQIGHLRDCP